MGESEETLKEAAQRKTTEQAIELVFGLVFVGVMYYVQNRDEWRHVKMATALVTKRFAQKQADWWQRVADHAATVYNKEKA